MRRDLVARGALFVAELASYQSSGLVFGLLVKECKTYTGEEERIRERGERREPDRMKLKETE